MYYIICILLVGLNSYFAERKDKKSYLIFCAVILSLFCGFRGIGTGVDTENYYNFMSYVRSRGISFGSDIGFSAISYFLMGIFKNPYYPLLVYAIVTNFLIVLRLWDFREEASLCLMLLIYVTMQYPYTFNIVRQYLAISIIFWGTRYIETGKYFKYILLNIVAAMIHTSAILCFSILFVTVGNNTKNNKTKILGYGLSIVFVFAGVFLLNDNVVKYSKYFVTSDATVYGMVILKFLCLVLVLVSNKMFTNREFSVSTNGELRSMRRQISILYSVGLLLSALGMWFTFMNRIGFYFMSFEMPFWGQTVRAKVNNKIYKVIIGVIIIYVLLSTYIAGESADNLFYYQSFLKN